MHLYVIILIYMVLFTSLIQTNALPMFSKKKGKKCDGSRPLVSIECFNKHVLKKSTHYESHIHAGENVNYEAGQILGDNNSERYNVNTEKGSKAKISFNEKSSAPSSPQKSPKNSPKYGQSSYSYNDDNDVQDHYSYSQPYHGNYRNDDDDDGQQRQEPHTFLWHNYGFRGYR